MMDGMDWDKLLSDYLPDFLIGTVVLGTIFGAIVEAIRRTVKFVLTQKYRGWKISVHPMDPDRQPYIQELLWDEVRRFEQSPFENRKFIQSVCTSENVRIKAGLIDTDKPHGWVYLDKAQKVYRFDFTKIPDEVRA